MLAAATLTWPLRVRGVDGSAGPGRRPAADRRVDRATLTPSGLNTSGGAAGQPSGRILRLFSIPMALLTVVAAGAAAGIAGSLASAAVLATGAAVARQALGDRRRRLAQTDILAGLRMLSRELRAGAEPAVAAANAGTAARGQGAQVLIGVAQLARFDSALSGSIDDGSKGPRAEVQERLRSGWLLTRRYGLAFTPLVDALAIDLSEQLAADAERAGQVAGPRMSGYVMAALPLMGLALGVGMGADPVRVLLATPVGSVLLVVGVTLTCAGLLWSARIVGR